MNQKEPVPFVVHLLGLTVFALTTAEFMVAGMMPSLTINAGYGLRSPLWVGAVLAALGLMSLAPYLRFQRCCVKRAADVR